MDPDTACTGCTFLILSSILPAAVKYFRMMDQGKLLMFRNRLEKMYRHRSRQARRMGVSCYRVYDHDLPEFPFCIEFYGEHLYVAEYQRHHGMDEEQHQLWLKESMDCIAEVLGVAHEQIFLSE